METLVKRNGNGTTFPEFPSLLDDFTREWLSWPRTTDTKMATLPAVNIRETGNSYELEVAAPGMRKNDFHVELDNNSLVISAQKKEEKKEDHKTSGYTRREFNYQSFSRTFNLSEKMIERDKISAKYEDGVLHVTIPKAEEAKVKPAKQIKVT